MHRTHNEPFVYNNQPHQAGTYANNDYHLRNNPAPLQTIIQEPYQENHYVERREEPTVYHSNNQVHHAPVESNLKSNDTRHSNVRGSKYN